MRPTGRVVDELQRTFETPGVVSEFGRVREWHSGPRPGSSVVHVELEEGMEGAPDRVELLAGRTEREG